MGKNQSKAKDQGKIEKVPVKYKEIYLDYIIHNTVIGTGQSGDIITCTNKETKKKYALKILYHSNDDEREKAKNECMLHWHASRTCPHIVKVIDIYDNELESHKAYFLVMEYMMGGKLIDKLNELAKINNPLTEQNVAKMIYQICSAVKHMHDLDIAHRDIHPDNLLLSTKDNTAVIKLTDFGTAISTSMLAKKIVGSDRISIDKMYEIARNNEFSHDIWGIGLVWYILYDGHSPLDEGIHLKRNAFESPQWNTISSEVKNLLAGMLDPDRERRLKINDIMKNDWITQFAMTPKTPLTSVLPVWKKNYDNWSNIKNETEIAYNHMRINWNNTISLKNLSDQNIKNPLLERRRKNKPEFNSTTGNDASNIEPLISKTSVDR